MEGLCGYWVDLQDIGLNATFVAFTGTVILAILASYGRLAQANKIRVTNTGKSVPMILYVYNLVSFIAAAVYGLHIHSLALFFSGLAIALFSIPVLVCLWKVGVTLSRFKQFLSVVFVAGLAMMAFSDLREIIFTVFAVGSVFIMAVQPYKIAKNRSSGAVDFTILAVGFINSLFWIVYSFAVGDIFLMIINPCFLIVNITTIVLWFRFRRKKAMTT